jgi:hypothetical protein
MRRIQQAAAAAKRFRNFLPWHAPSASWSLPLDPFEL